MLFNLKTRRSYFCTMALKERNNMPKILANYVEM